MMVVLCLEDTKAETFANPIFYSTVGEAMRAFADAVNGAGETPVAKWPEDFHLWLLGSFDPDTAELTLNPKKHVCCGADVRIAASVTEIN